MKETEIVAIQKRMRQRPRIVDEGWDYDTSLQIERDLYTAIEWIKDLQDDVWFRDLAEHTTDCPLCRRGECSVRNTIRQKLFDNGSIKDID